MTPVLYLSDAFIGNGAEPWRVPSVEELPDISVANAVKGEGTFLPYGRDPETLSRPWAIPGTPGLEHRIGGLEKLDGLGTVNYDADNHHRMTVFRRDKVAGIARDIPDQDVFGPESGELLIVGWGSTFGALRSAAESLQAEGKSVAHAHVRVPVPVPGKPGRRAAALSGRCWCPSSTSASSASCSGVPTSWTPSPMAASRGKPFRISEIVDEAEPRSWRSGG